MSVAVAVCLTPLVTIAHDGSTPPLLAVPQIQIVGASVMLRLQREGAKVYDFRSSGQAIPGAIRTAPTQPFSPSSQMVLIGEESRVLARARDELQRHPDTNIFIVPAHQVAAYPDFDSVRQIEPRAAYRLMQSQQTPVFDFAESEEFDHAHVPQSTRIDWTSVLQNDWSAVESYRGKTIMVICPVGSRSQLAAQKLENSGVRVLNVRGGMFAWQNAELPVAGQSARTSTSNAN